MVLCCNTNYTSTIHFFFNYIVICSFQHIAIILSIHPSVQLCSPWTDCILKGTCEALNYPVIVWSAFHLAVEIAIRCMCCQWNNESEYKDNNYDILTLIPPTHIISVWTM